MTTRSLTIVKEKKEWTKADISWYDGYPSYVGVRVLKKIRKDLNKLPKEILEKELTFYDYKNNVTYATPAIPMVVDESDERYVDLVFNFTIG